MSLNSFSLPMSKSYKIHTEILKSLKGRKSFPSTFQAKEVGAYVVKCAKLEEGGKKRTEMPRNRQDIRTIRKKRIGEKELSRQWIQPSGTRGSHKQIRTCKAQAGALASKLLRFSMTSCRLWPQGDHLQMHTRDTTRPLAAHRSLGNLCKLVIGKTPGILGNDWQYSYHDQHISSIVILLSCFEQFVNIKKIFLPFNQQNQTHLPYRGNSQVHLHTVKHLPSQLSRTRKTSPLSIRIIWSLCL